MTLKEYHQKSLKEQTLAKKKYKCEIIYIYMEIDFHGELIEAQTQSGQRFYLNCLRVIL